MQPDAVEFYVNHMKRINPVYKKLQFDETRMEWVKECNDEPENKPEIIEIEPEIKVKPRKELTARGRKLREFVKVRGIVLDRDDYTCVQCGSTDRIQVHHMQALANGGDNMASNLQTLCYKCHMEKHEGQPIYNLMAKQL